LPRINAKTEYSLTFGDLVWSVVLKEKADSVKISLSVLDGYTRHGLKTFSAPNFNEALLYAWKKAKYESAKIEKQRKAAYEALREYGRSS
jgi:hypothetical protein